jgi:hypothetical protein
MSYYRHTQVGTLILGMLGAGMLLIVAILLVGGRAAPLLVVLAILVVSAVLFAALTVEIQGRDLTVRFGPGLIRKRVPLATIRSCAVVRNPWWYGWGIRRTPRGWLYNVSGFAAVELTLQDGRRLRIGTDEPERLCQAIDQAQSDAQALPSTGN